MVKITDEEILNIEEETKGIRNLMESLKKVDIDLFNKLKSFLEISIEIEKTEN